MSFKLLIFCIKMKHFLPFFQPLFFTDNTEFPFALLLTPSLSKSWVNLVMTECMLDQR